MCVILVSVVAVIAIAVTGLLFYQGRRISKDRPQYVALGSSFAAGIGLGARAPASPFVCMRSVNGYPQQLARMRGLSLVDMTCSGATAVHILRGGRFFLRPQLDALSEATELVTLTAGGNDIKYVGDLAFMAARTAPSLPGWALRRFWRGPLPDNQRDYALLQANLTTLLRNIRRRAPLARIVLATYPRILPPDGTCTGLNITPDQADAMRMVGDRLATLSGLAAAEGGAILVDMHRLGAAHHACAELPWVNGWRDTVGTQYHPTLAGAQATAHAIAQALGGAEDTL